MKKQIVIVGNEHTIRQKARKLAKILNEASNESLSVSDNEESKELPCLSCKYYGHQDYCCYCDDNYSAFVKKGNG